MTIATTSIQRFHMYGHHCGWFYFSDRFTGHYRLESKSAVLEVEESYQERCGFLWLEKRWRKRYVWVPACRFRVVKNGFTDKPHKMIA